MDSTVCRAHQHAAGARRDGAAQLESPGGLTCEPDDHALGRSRGGSTTKVHLACEQRQKPLAVVLTADRRGDAPQFRAVLERICVPGQDPAVPAPARTASARTRPGTRSSYEVEYRDALRHEHRLTAETDRSRRGPPCPG
ncbi:hypothetical protein [Planomonospora sphaerica]|uniref:hypothetical protein n=1 Tax=Planomonospora sphaerica TaxID=161355 RepID=UPI000A42A5D5